jgi:glycosyltransferase involved in cell wall biosynthesis
MKPKALVFYTYLPPWRIDVFNEMGKYYDLTIIFLNADCEGFSYNRELLTSKLSVNYVFWNKGFKVGTKPFRFGIFKLLKKYNPDVVFSHEYSPASILVSLYKKLNLFQFKFIITTSNNLSMAQETSKLKNHIRKFVLSSTDGLIVYSDSVKEWYKNRFPHLKVEICPNIQNPESLLAHSASFTKYQSEYISQYNLCNCEIILYIGRLVHVKGLDLLIEAFGKTENYNWKLVIVGEGREKEKLIHLAMNKGLSDKVIFPGYLDGEALYAWYSLANFFILPSRFEPFGAVVNEALVFGCPVVASKYIGATDFIEEHKNGLLFDPLNSDEFVNTLDLSMRLFNTFNQEKNNLMTVDFQKSVQAFKTIIHEN